MAPGNCHRPPHRSVGLPHRCNSLRRHFYAWPCMDFCLFLLGGLDSRNETHQQASRPCDTLHWWWSRWEHCSPKQQHDIVKHRHLRNEVASVFRQEWRCASSVLSPANFEQPKAFCCLQQRKLSMKLYSLGTSDRLLGHVIQAAAAAVCSSSPVVPHPISHNGHLPKALQGFALWSLM